MESTDLICDICKEFYDLKGHLPIHFPHNPPYRCTKTTCLDCFEKTINEENASLKCPWDRQSLKKDAKGKITPFINKQLHQLLQDNKDYEICPYHPNKFQRLFCKIDQVKICTSCHLSTGEEGHKNHDVDFIENLKPEIEKRWKLLGEGVEKSKIFENAIKASIDDKKRFFEEKIECQAKVHVLARLKTDLMVRDYISRQNKNAQEKAGVDFGSQEQNADYQEFKTLNISNMLRKSPEEITAQYDEGKLDRVFRECQNEMNQQASDLYENFARIYDYQEIGTALEFRSYVSIQVRGKSLKLLANNNMKTVVIDLEKLKGVKEMRIIFDKFDFNRDDMKAIEFVFSNLQNQLESIDLYYNNTRDTVTLTKFETHAVLFSLMIFTNPKNYKSITLAFENSDGSERYLRFLEESVFPESDLLETFSLTFINANLNEKNLESFFNQSKSRLKELKSLELRIKGSLISSQIPSQEIVFELPNLEQLYLSFNVKKLFGKSTWMFIDELLMSTISLRKCTIRLLNSSSSGLSFISKCFSLCNLESLVIDMPHSLFHEKELDGLVQRLKKDVKTLEYIAIYSETFSHEAGVHQYL